MLWAKKIRVKKNLQHVQYVLLRSFIMGTLFVCPIQLCRYEVKVKYRALVYAASTEDIFQQGCRPGTIWVTNEIVTGVSQFQFDWLHSMPKKISLVSEELPLLEISVTPSLFKWESMLRTHGILSSSWNNISEVCDVKKKICYLYFIFLFHWNVIQTWPRVKGILKSWDGAPGIQMLDLQPFSWQLTGQKLQSASRMNHFIELPNE